MFQFAQNEATANRRRIFFYAVDATDGYTAVTASITSGAVLIVKNGVTPGTSPVSPTFTHISNGLWYYEMTAAHLDTQGVLTVTITGTNIRTVQLIGYVYAGDPMAAIPTFPTNFSSLSINASGQVTVGGYGTGLAPLQPTVAGRTLDVTTTGEAGIDWGNIGSPTTTVNFTGTTISTSQSVASVSGSVNSVTNAVTVGTINNNVITAASIATDAIDSDAIANSAITIRMSGDGTPSEGRIIAGSIANDVWNAATASYTTAGTFGKLMDILKKANFVIEGTTVAGSTTTSINTGLTGYLTNAFNNQTILFISGALAGTSSLISTSSSGGGVFTLDIALPAAPASGVDFVVLGTHVHSTQEIANVTWTTDISGISGVGQAGRYVTDGAIAASNASASASVIEGVAYRENLADVLLGRNVAGGSNTGRLVKEALYALRNKSEIVGSTLNVYNATDGAIAWSATVASSAGANPVTGVDPA